METQRGCFQALRVHGWQSQALCRPFKTIHGEFARTLLLPMPARRPFERGTENPTRVRIRIRVRTRVRKT